MSEQILKQILSELKEMKASQDSMKVEMQGMKVEMQGMKADIDGLVQGQNSLKAEMQDMKAQMNSRFDTLETKMASAQNDISDLKITVNRLEQNTHEEVVAILKEIENIKEMKANDSEIVVLNNRLFKLESTVQKLVGQ